MAISKHEKGYGTKSTLKIWSDAPTPKRLSDKLPATPAVKPTSYVMQSISLGLVGTVERRGEQVIWAVHDFYMDSALDSSLQSNQQSTEFWPNMAQTLSREVNGSRLYFEFIYT